MFRSQFAFLLTSLTPALLWAFCPLWSPPEPVAHLSTSIFKEISGMAFSSKTQKLYLVSDGSQSQNPFSFYIYDLKQKTHEIKTIPHLFYQDMEALSLASCPKNFSKKDCFYFADIGNNAQKRKTLTITILEEDFSKDFRFFQLKFKYPENTFDAESMAVDSKGDIYILTKNIEFPFLPQPSKLFYLSHQDIDHQNKSLQTLKYLRTINFENFFPPDKSSFHVPTDMVFSKDQSTILILTYSGVLEYNLKNNKSIVAIFTDEEFFPSAEAIAYKDESFLYTFDSGNPDPDEDPSLFPIYQVRCKSF